MKTKTAYLPTPNESISQWLDTVFNIKTTREYDEADLVVFPGGLDVDPNLYNEPPGQRTSFDKNTDKVWTDVYKRTIKDGKKLLGICKGSQFLSVMAGCSLFQHVDNHALTSSHSITTSNGTFEVTSTHHQMINPFVLQEEDFDVLAHSLSKRSTIYLDGYDDEVTPPKQEIEAIFFKGNGVLAIQFHPEFMSVHDPVQKVIAGWIDSLFSYELTEFFDKYHRKISYSKFKEKGSDLELGEISEETFNEFINHYIK